jgi:RNA polymerase sigma-70 factor, ECF subfamily
MSRIATRHPFQQGHPAEPKLAEVVQLRPAERGARESSERDRRLFEAVIGGERWARAQLFDDYAPQLERILQKLVGRDADLDVEDLLHDSFVAAFEGIGSLQEPAALPKWLHTIAARTAYRAIRKKRTWRWIRFWEPERLVELESTGTGTEASTVEACRRVQVLLSSMPARQRVAFVLRHVEGMELTEVAEACEVSLATAKRDLAEARDALVQTAESDDLLKRWIDGGSACRS